MPKSVDNTKQSLAVFERYKQAINQSLGDYFAKLPDAWNGLELPPIVRQTLKFIDEYTMRPGKRVRGAMAAMAYDNLTGQQLSKNGQKLAVVMELIQSYALIVDDVTDQSDLRRGEPTVHRLYEWYDKQIGSRQAEQLAFYTGTITGHLANLLLAQIDERPERVCVANGYVQKNIVTTTFGQLDDIMQEISREASRAAIVRKYTLKTSYYTFINPLQTAMALAGISDQMVFAQVAKFGEAAGIAFQTHDDYLGVFGGDETGKPTIDDLKEGKLTILVEHVLAHGKPSDVKELKGLLGNPNLTEDSIVQARAIFDRTGATMETRQTAERYAKKALQALEQVTIWDQSFKAQLAALVTYSIKRES